MSLAIGEAQATARVLPRKQTPSGLVAKNEERRGRTKTAGVIPGEGGAAEEAAHPTATVHRAAVPVLRRRVVVGHVKAPTAVRRTTRVACPPPTPRSVSRAVFH
jgi:hypothetical protein